MSGIGVCILPFVNDYVGLATLLSVIGLFAGGFFALIAVMLAEKLGIARLHSAFGLVVMFMGASFIFAAPISGKLVRVSRCLRGWETSKYWFPVAIAWVLSLM